MKKLTTSVFATRNGSMYAVVGSGNSDMSDSWIAWKPRIEEPSKFEAVVEDRLVERRHRHGEVLHHAGQVAEPDVDHLDALVLDVLQQLVAVLRTFVLLGRDAAGEPTESCEVEGPERRCTGLPAT